MEPSNLTEPQARAVSAGVTVLCYPLKQYYEILSFYAKNLFGFFEELRMKDSKRNFVHTILQLTILF